MPVTSEAAQHVPPWSELTAFHIHRLDADSTIALHATAPDHRHRLVVVDGTIVYASISATAPAVIDLPPGETQLSTMTPSVVVELIGTWGDDLGGCGVFSVVNTEFPDQRGDPTSYERSTAIDNHYHDCDEYWIIVDGSGTAVSEGESFEIGPGDCVITGMGDHHDFPRVTAPVRAVFFETTLGGARRRGHLWNHTHGLAVPARRE